MAIRHVLAVIPVSDIDASHEFYTSLFGRGPDNNPMPSLIEWQPLPGAFVQVTVDADRAGHGQMNLAVDDLESHRAEVQERGIETGEVIDANKGVQLCSVSDPDGNVITFIGSFRVRY